MAVNWLKGLVAPTAQYVGQAPQNAPMGGGFPPQDAPPIGGSPYGAYQPPMGGPPTGGGMPMGQPPMGGGMPMGQPPMGGMPMGQPPTGGMPMGGLPDATQWSTGTHTQGGAASPAGAIAPIAGGNTAALEKRIADLSNDVASLALFARALLTVLEESKVVSRDQFMETKNRLDMLDGKMDDH